MGTKSTVKFYSRFDKQPVLSVYQQYDGYIEGVGHTLANWLKKKRISNGYLHGTMELGFANGMGCLAAQYVAEHKTCIGSFYATTADDVQEYNYEVRFIDGNFIIEVRSFRGTPDELLNYKEEESEF